MIHLIYIYFIINSFIAGYTLKDTYRWDTITRTVLYTSFALLVGVPFYIILLITCTFSTVLGWLYREVRFQYRFYFTNYWDKIMLDDNYSPKYKTLREKLDITDKLIKISSKQLRRHSRQVYKKYENE